MKNFFLITNLAKDENFQFTNKIQNYILEKGGTCSFIERDGTDPLYAKMVLEAIPPECECIIVVGGDGTLIKAARDTFSLDIPLIGINMGNLGYLCELEGDNIWSAIDRLFDGDFVIENRMMLEGKIIKENGDVFQESALNDIVLHRTGSLHVVPFDVSVNGEYLNSYQADGMILATPTGSTAYNLSAGGPIVDPKASLMLLTPINSHMMNSTSIVLDQKDKIKIRTFSRGKENEVQVEVSFDGATAIPLSTGDVVSIKKSKNVTKIVKLSKISYLEILRKKMSIYR